MRRPDILLSIGVMATRVNPRNMSHLRSNIVVPIDALPRAQPRSAMMNMVP